jgi:thioredoxin-like negative regulator of GroEL
VGASGARPAPVCAESTTAMANRFNVKIPVTENPKEKEVAAVHVTELAEKDFEAQVVGAPLPVVVDFYATDSKPCEELAPRFAAVAEKFAGKIRFLKILQKDAAALAGKLGVTSAPTLVFFKSGVEKGERLSGQEIKRTALKAQVEALLA